MTRNAQTSWDDAVDISVAGVTAYIETSDSLVLVLDRAAVVGLKGNEGVRGQIQLWSTGTPFGTRTLREKDIHVLDSARSGATVWVPRDKLARVSLIRQDGRHHGWGVLHGLGLGAAIGAGIGVITGATMKLCDPTEEEGWLPCLMEPQTRKEAVGFGVAIGTIGGGALGLLVGAIVGSPVRTRYEVSPSFEIAVWGPSLSFRLRR